MNNRKVFFKVIVQKQATSRTPIYFPTISNWLINAYFNLLCLMMRIVLFCRMLKKAGFDTYYDGYEPIAEAD